MKKIIFKPALLIIFFTCIPLISSEQTDSKNSGNINNYYFVNNPPPKSSNSNLIMSILTSLISVASIFVIWFNVKRQIKSVEKNIEKQFKLQELNFIRENISELIFEIKKPDGGKLETNNYISDMHIKTEAKILSYLDISKPIEKKLHDCITKFKIEKITNKNQWVDEILLIENDFITYKKQ